jgi:hypothetical protein
MNAQVETMLDDPIEITLAEQSLALAKMRQRWNAIKDFYRPIVNALHRLGLEPRLSGDIDLSFTGDAKKLTAVVTILRHAGMQTTGARPKPGDTTWSAYYSHPDCETKLWLYFTSSVCRRVKVGTKMVEQDVFETRCGDITLVEDALPPPAEVPAIADEIPF